MPATNRSNDYAREVKSWDDLSKLIAHFSEFNGIPWLFRGVSDASYKLIPKVGRPRSKSLRKRITPFSKADELAAFDAFRQQAKQYVSTTHTTLEWLSMAQHFGVPTRLLDWSDSLLIAAWFAVLGPGDATDAAIWVSRDNPAIDPDFGDDPFSLSSPAVYRPPNISPRIGAQGSVLMVCPSPTDPLPADVASRIVILGSARQLLRKRLNACGVNARTVFSDLGGLGEHVAWLYQNNWLANHRRGVPLAHTLKVFTKLAGGRLNDLIQGPLQNVKTVALNDHARKLPIRRSGN